MNNFLSLFGKSYKTTIMGVAAIAGAIAAALKAHYDGDPTTNVDFMTTFTSISAGVGLMTARNNKVSSEDVGIKNPLIK